MLIHMANINILYDKNKICHNFHIILNIYYHNMAYNKNFFSRFLSFHSNFAGNLFSGFCGLSEFSSIFYF